MIRQAGWLWDNQPALVFGGGRGWLPPKYAEVSFLVAFEEFPGVQPRDGGHQTPSKQAFWLFLESFRGRNPMLVATKPRRNKLFGCF